MKSFTYKNAYCDLSFEPDKLEGREVYNVSVNGEHSIYMTKEFVDALLNEKSANGELNIEHIKRSSTINNFIGKEPTLDKDINIPGIDEWRGNVMNQFILLDLPKGGAKELQLDSGSIELTPTLYRDSTNEIVTIRPKKIFFLNNGKRDMDLKFPNNDIEAKRFAINNTNKTSKTVIDLNIKGGIANEIVIKGLAGFKNKTAFVNQTAYLYFETKEGSKSYPTVYINDFVIPYREKYDKEYCMKFYGNELVVENSIIRDDYDLLHDECYFKTNGSIRLIKSAFGIAYGEGASIAIEAEDGIEIYNSFTRIDGHPKVGGKISILVGDKERLELWFVNSSIDGSVNYRSIADCKEPRLTLFNADVKVGKDNALNLTGNVVLKSTSIENEKSLSLYNVFIEGSKAKNISNIKLADIYYANLENFLLENKSKKDEINFKIGTPLQDRDLIKSFKDATIVLEDGDSFEMRGSFLFKGQNCSFNGKNSFILNPSYIVKEGENNVEKSLVAMNSLFTNSNLVLTFSSKEPVECYIIDSELKEKIRCKDLTRVETSYLENIATNNITEISSLSLVNYVNNDEPNPKKLTQSSFSKEESSSSVGVVNKGLEIL